MILITGAGGMLGSALSAMLGDKAVALSRKDLDITDASAVSAAIAGAKPDVVINAAAFTNVDEAESRADEAFAINRDGAHNVARAANDAGAFCVHISTDFVFDGALGRFYREDDAPNPICVYAESKLAGERAVRAFPRTAVARTAWVYGAGQRTFLSQILDLARAGKQLTVVDDQTGSPTWVHDLAEGLIAFASRPTPGIFHTAGGGAASRFEFARAIVEAAGLDPACVSPVKTSDLPPRPAPRPPYAPLEAHAWAEAGYTPLREWREALKDAIKEF
ncbi:MAG: dTDP-4-dehydrorhamnose reductase [Actinomycetota bacterium]